MAPNKDVVDIASAVGTCAAALIALVLGIGGALSSKRTARTSARLTAARLVPQINAVISALEAVSSHLKRCTALDDLQKISDELHMMENEAADRLFDVPLPVLASLSSLDNDCATNLAGALGFLDSLRRDVVRRVPDVWVWGECRISRGVTISRWASLAEKTDNRLRSVLSDCVAASRMHP